MTLTTERQQFAEQNEMSMDFVNWFFDEKKDGCGNAWLIMAAAMWEGWKGRGNREAQPVATVLFSPHGVNVSTIDVALPDGTKLYTAPPAPAVPEEAKVGEMPFLGNSEPGYVRGWNDCRAAMMAQPVSGGYKLADGWVACSERMPAPFIDVIASDGKQTFTAHFIDESDWWCLVSQLAEEPGDVTHWMPLPAAPEGGK